MSEYTSIELTSRQMEERVKAFQRRLYRAAKANGKRRFGILYDKVHRWDVLVTAWRRVAANHGAAGVDRQSIDWIRDEYGVRRFLSELQEQLRDCRYTADAIRRTYIPKEPGKWRALGIPTVCDRVVQMAVKLVIEPLFEADFCDCSYGFRPRRSNKDAAQLVHRAVNRRKSVVDLDLKSYFDMIPHGPLLDLVRRRVSDRRVLHLIRAWLTAGILENGELTYGTRGTPQGGVLSPLLSNIYLHELDRTWDPADGLLVRFADDLVVLCWNEGHARAALRKLCTRLAELQLPINEEKTSLRHVSDGFDFLGFTYREAYSPGQGRKVRIKYPRAKSMKKVRSHLKQRLRDVPLGEPLEAAVTCANRTLRGWANYFRLGNSSQAGRSLSHYACSQLRLWLRRKKHCKESQQTRRWPDGFFYDRGLHYVPTLLHA
jgi:group II intron reverse transcriptase/maturase